LQEHLGRSGQYLPFDPPSPASATIGGILAANAGGPGRHAYGWPRDWTLGMQVALADGTLARSGGRVVKNVAGYDMGKLYIGSFGTLGVIVEAAFKVVPLPEACATLIASFDSPSRAAEAALAVHKRNLAVESLAVASPSALEDTSNWTLLVASAGGAAAVERTLQEAASICRDQDAAEGQRLFDDRASTAWEAARQLMLPSRDNGSLLTRAGLIPSQVGAFLEQQTSLSSKRGLTAASLAYPAVGSVYGVWDGEGLTDGGTDLVSSLRTAATVNAPVVLMACPISLKQEIDVWGDGRSDLPLMRRIKQQLDPRSTMSPGRFLGRM
jgi:glycolate oxidase FAD binding subunit